MLVKEDLGSAYTVLNFCHHEVKGEENLNVQKALEQALADRQYEQFPLVAHKKSAKPWAVYMYAEDFIALVYKAFISGMALGSSSTIMNAALNKGFTNENKTGTDS